MAKLKAPKPAPKAPGIDTELKIEQRPVADLTEYEKNARIIPQSGVDLVAKSISQNGFRQPLVITKDGIVIVGHTRLRAARQLGLKTVPCNVMDGTPEQVRAYRLMDNRSNQESTWDQDILREELGELNALFKDDPTALSEVTGFESSELDAFIGTLATTGGGLAPKGGGSAGEGTPGGRPRAEEDDEEKCHCPRCGFGFHPRGGTRVIKKAKKLFGEAED